MPKTAPHLDSPSSLYAYIYTPIRNSRILSPLTLDPPPPDKVCRAERVRPECRRHMSPSYWPPPPPHIAAPPPAAQPLPPPPGSSPSSSPVPPLRCAAAARPRRPSSPRCPQAKLAAPRCRRCRLRPPAAATAPAAASRRPCAAKTGRPRPPFSSLPARLAGVASGGAPRFRSETATVTLGGVFLLTPEIADPSASVRGPVTFHP